MKNSNIIILIFLFVFIIIGCNKMPFQDKKKWLVGTWDVSNYTVDGADSTDYLKSDSRYCTVRFVYDRKSDHNTFYACSHDGSWSFANNNKNFFFGLVEPPNSNYHGIGPYLADSILLWKIDEWKKTVFKISINYKNKNYSCLFKKQ